jgi:two-component system NtrC family sensor kinase
LSKPSPTSNRVLLIDDNVSIHGDFRKVLSSSPEDSAQETLAQLEADLFGERKRVPARPNFEVDSA